MPPMPPEVPGHDVLDLTDGERQMFDALVNSNEAGKEHVYDMHLLDAEQTDHAASTEAGEGLHHIEAVANSYVLGKRIGTIDQQLHDVDSQLSEADKLDMRDMDALIDRRNELTADRSIYQIVADRAEAGDRNVIARLHEADRLYVSSEDREDEAFKALEHAADFVRPNEQGSINEEADIDAAAFEAMMQGGDPAEAKKRSEQALDRDFKAEMAQGAEERDQERGHVRPLSRDEIEQHYGGSDAQNNLHASWSQRDLDDVYANPNRGIRDEMRTSALRLADDEVIDLRDGVGETTNEYIDGDRGFDDSPDLGRPSTWLPGSSPRLDVHTPVLARRGILRARGDTGEATPEAPVAAPVPEAEPAGRLDRVLNFTRRNWDRWVNDPMRRAYLGLQNLDSFRDAVPEKLRSRRTLMAVGGGLAVVGAGVMIYNNLDIGFDGPEQAFASNLTDLASGTEQQNAATDFVQQAISLNSGETVSGNLIVPELLSHGLQAGTPEYNGALRELGESFYRANPDLLAQNPDFFESMATGQQYEINVPSSGFIDSVIEKWRAGRS